MGCPSQTIDATVVSLYLAAMGDEIVMEAPRSHSIHCTKEIIAQSVPRNSRWCIVAIAVRDQIQDAYSVEVTAETIRFNIRETRFIYPTQARVAAILIRYDTTGRRPRAFKFRMNASQGYTCPVVRRPHAKRGPDKIKRGTKPKVRHSLRRYVGLKQIVVTK